MPSVDGCVTTESTQLVDSNDTGTMSVECLSEDPSVTNDKGKNKESDDDSIHLRLTDDSDPEPPVNEADNHNEDDVLNEPNEDEILNKIDYNNDCDLDPSAEERLLTEDDDIEIPAVNLAPKQSATDDGEIHLPKTVCSQSDSSQNNSQETLVNKETFSNNLSEDADVEMESVKDLSKEISVENQLTKDISEVESDKALSNSLEDKDDLESDDLLELSQVIDANEDDIDNEEKECSDMDVFETVDQCEELEDEEDEANDIDNGEAEDEEDTEGEKEVETENSEDNFEEEDDQKDDVTVSEGELPVVDEPESGCEDMNSTGCDDIETASDNEKTVTEAFEVLQEKSNICSLDATAENTTITDKELSIENSLSENQDPYKVSSKRLKRNISLNIEVEETNTVKEEIDVVHDRYEIESIADKLDCIEESILKSEKCVSPETEDQTRRSQKRVLFDDDSDSSELTSVKKAKTSNTFDHDDVNTTSDVSTTNILCAPSQSADGNSADTKDSSAVATASAVIELDLESPKSLPDVGTNSINENQSENFDSNCHAKTSPKKEIFPKLRKFAEKCITSNGEEIKSLTLQDIEEFCLQKICEAIVYRHQLGDAHQRLKAAEHRNEILRRDYDVLTKQARDLQIVIRKLISDIRTSDGNKNNAIKHLQPLKITRSVGLQVKFQCDPAISNTNAPGLNGAQITSNSKRLSGNDTTSPLSSNMNDSSTENISTSPNMTSTANRSITSSNRNGDSTLVAVRKTISTLSLTPGTILTTAAPNKMITRHVASPVAAPKRTQLPTLIPFGAPLSIKNQKGSLLGQALVTGKPTANPVTSQSNRIPANTTGTKVLHSKPTAMPSITIPLATMVTTSNSSTTAGSTTGTANSTGVSSTTSSSTSSPSLSKKCTAPVANGVIDLTDEDDKLVSSSSGHQPPTANAVLVGTLAGVSAISGSPTVASVKFSSGNSLTRSSGGTLLTNAKIGNTPITSSSQLMYVVQPANGGTAVLAPATQGAVLLNFQTTSNGVIGNGQTASIQLKPAITSSTSTSTVASTNSSVITKAVKTPSAGKKSPETVSGTSTILTTARHPAPLPSSNAFRSTINSSGIASKVLKPVPPKPILSIRKTDNGIILQWKMPYELDGYEAIASYQLYAYQETAMPPSSDMWRKIGDVKALALPMACTLTQFADKNKYYFAVRSVDVHKRFGPFSDPEEISI